MSAFGKCRFFAWVLCFGAAAAAHGGNRSDVALRAQEDEKPALNALDVGLTLGTPALFNLCVTKWGVGSKPLLLRFSGGYWGSNAWGFQPEVGWAFDREGLLRQYVSFGISWFRYAPAADPFPRFGGSMRELDFFGAGFFYGLHWNDFTLQIGLPIGRYRGVDTSGAAVDTVRPSPHMQLGYSFYY